MEYLKILIKQLHKKNVYIFSESNVFSNLLNLNLNTMNVKPYILTKKNFEQHINKSKKTLLSNSIIC